MAGYGMGPPNGPLPGREKKQGWSAITRIPSDIRAAKDYLTTVPAPQSAQQAQTPQAPNGTTGVMASQQRNPSADEVDFSQMPDVTPTATNTLNTLTQPQPQAQTQAPQVQTPYRPPQQPQDSGTVNTLDFSGLREANLSQITNRVAQAGQGLGVASPRLDPSQGVGQPEGNFYTGNPGQGIEGQSRFRSNVLGQQEDLYDRFNSVMDQMANAGDATTAERANLGRMANAMATALGQSTQAGTSNFSTDIGADNRLGVTGIDANAAITRTGANNASSQAVADLNAQAGLAKGLQSGQFGLAGDALSSHDNNNAYRAQVASAQAGNQPSPQDQARLQLAQYFVSQNDMMNAAAIINGNNPEVDQFISGADGRPILQQQTGTSNFGALDPQTREELLQQRLNRQ